MLSVEDSYRENPYHNSFHAADVTQVLSEPALKQSCVCESVLFSFFQSTHVLLNSPNLEV